MAKILFIIIILLSIINKAFSQIEGAVIDKKRIAIVNAVIVLSDTTGKPIDTVLSDNRGGYFFKGLKPGKYVIEAKASNFQSAIYKNVVITSPPEESNEGDDTYYAIRLDIILTPLKK